MMNESKNGLKAERKMTKTNKLFEAAKQAREKFMSAELMRLGA